MKNLIKFIGILFVLGVISGCYVEAEDGLVPGPSYIYPEYHEHHGAIVHYYDDGYYHHDHEGWHDNGRHEGWYNHEHGHGHGHDNH